MDRTSVIVSAFQVTELWLKGHNLPHVMEPVGRQSQEADTRLCLPDLEFPFNEPFLFFTYMESCVTVK